MFHKIEMGILHIFPSFDFSRSFHIREEQWGDGFLWLFNTFLCEKSLCFISRNSRHLGKDSQSCIAGIYTMSSSFWLRVDVRDAGKWGGGYFILIAWVWEDLVISFLCDALCAEGSCACLRHSVEILWFSRYLHVSLVTYNNTSWSNLNLLFSSLDRITSPPLGAWQPLSPTKEAELWPVQKQQKLRETEHRTRQEQERRPRACPSSARLVNTEPVWVTPKLCFIDTELGEGCARSCPESCDGKHWTFQKNHEVWWASRSTSLWITDKSSIKHLWIGWNSFWNSFTCFLSIVFQKLYESNHESLSSVTVCCSMVKSRF